MAWKQAEVDQLRSLAASGDLFYTEIAAQLNRPVQSVRWKARQLGLGQGGSERVGQWNSKHRHLRREVMEYFVTHSAEETRLEFGLSDSEFKSLTTICYRLPEYAHLRKEVRTHNRWTVDELLFLLRHSGLQQREWIAEKIQRGSRRVIKEKLQSLGINSKTLNGMTIGRFRDVFGIRPAAAIAGKGGPGRSGLPTFFRIVPWVVVEAELERGTITAPEAFGIVVRSMAAFQRWIHGADPLMSLELAAGDGHVPPRVNRTYGSGLKSHPSSKKN